LNNNIKIFYNYSKPEQLEGDISSTHIFDKLMYCDFCNSVLILYNGHDHGFYYHHATVDLKFCMSCGWWIYQHFYESAAGGPTNWYFIKGTIKKFDIASVNTPCSILGEYLSKNFSDIQIIPPRKLEELVASIFREHFYCDVEMTKKTRDGGYDLVAINTEKQKMLVEVKRYRSDRKIGVSLIREMLGVLIYNNVSHGIIVTTSSFSLPAQEVVKNINYSTNNTLHLELKDSRDLLKWLRVLYEPGLFNQDGIPDDYGLESLIKYGRSKWEIF
jgi:restriction system protein